MYRRDEYAYILDVIPPGEIVVREPNVVRRGFPLGETYAQAIGETLFTLLELTIRSNAEVKALERVYIGSGQRDKVSRIVRRLRLSELTQTARENLIEVLPKIVEAQEKRFIDFVNRAGPITLKLHSLELLKGIGKKTLWVILEERRRKQFESFEDFKSRIGIDIKRLIVDRILRELEGSEKYYLFVGGAYIQTATRYNVI